MYRRPKFLEALLRIREQMARDSDYDVDRFAEMVRAGNQANAEISLTDQADAADVAVPGKQTAARPDAKRS